MKQNTAFSKEKKGKKLQGVLDSYSSVYMEWEIIRRAVGDKIKYKRALTAKIQNLEFI